MSGSPTIRSLKEMRSRGYLCEKTEHWNSFARITRDLYGFIDILCIRANSKDIAVQTTSSANIISRIEKIMVLPSAKTWLETGHRIVVHGWGKRGAMGKRKLWTLDEREIVTTPSGILIVSADVVEPITGAT